MLKNILSGKHRCIFSESFLLPQFMDGLGQFQQSLGPLPLAELHAVNKLIQKRQYHTNHVKCLEKFLCGVVLPLRKGR